MPEEITLYGYGEFNELVVKTYVKPYDYARQYGCRQQGQFDFYTLPYERGAIDEEAELAELYADGETDEVVPFEIWLNAEVKENTIPVYDGSVVTYTGLENKRMYGYTANSKLVEEHWEESFYPPIYSVLHDLYTKGLLKAGRYGILTAW